MSLSVRLALLVLLGAALWNTPLLLGKEPLDVILLVDDSLSVERGEADEAWRQVASVARALPREGLLHVLRFASDPVLEVAGVPLREIEASGQLDAQELPRSVALDRTQSDLERGLRAAFARVRLGNPAVLVVATDGVETRGDAEKVLAELKSAGVRVVALPLLLPVREADVWIDSVRTPSRVRVGEVVRVVATLGASSPAWALLRLEADGQEITLRRVKLDSAALEWIELELPVLSAGSHAIEVHLDASADPRPENNGSRAVIQVEGQPAAFYVTTDLEPPPLAASLQAGGWEVTLLTPARFAHALETSPGLVVLDDIAVADLPEAGWKMLERLVRFEAVGLLVLGGPNSFAAGGYRGSLLEGLLPVTAEGSEPRSKAALLFLVDTSGSMERDSEGRDRLALARQAINESAAALSEGDLVGISSFALQPREILPLGAVSAAGDLRLVSLPRASGGTRLRPALRHALETLSDASADQRLLVLVTDGFVPEEDLDPIAREIGEARIDFIALAVGADAELRSLQELASHSGGAVHGIDDAALLPRLMHSEVGKRLEPAVRERFRPRSAARLPFLFHTDTWPELDAYMVTRPRPHALVAIESERGDPIFAAHRQGAGRAAVLPAGLSSWARDWIQWSGWGPFVGALAQWLMRPPDPPQLHVRIQEGGGGLEFEMDALSEGGAWSAEPTAEVAVLDPTMKTWRLSLPALAPGHFAATLPAPVPGTYRVTASVGPYVRAVPAVRTAHDEFSNAHSMSRLKQWHAAGLIDSWREPGRSAALEPPRGKLRPRALLTMTALVLYLALLVYEERLVTPAR